MDIFERGVSIQLHFIGVNVMTQLISMTSSVYAMNSRGTLLLTAYITDSTPPNISVSVHWDTIEPVQCDVTNSEPLLQHFNPQLMINSVKYCCTGISLADVVLIVGYRPSITTTTASAHFYSCMTVQQVPCSTPGTDSHNSDFHPFEFSKWVATITNNRRLLFSKLRTCGTEWFKMVFVTLQNLLWPVGLMSQWYPGCNNNYQIKQLSHTHTAHTIDWWLLVWWLDRLHLIIYMFNWLVVWRHQVNLLLHN